AAALAGLGMLAAGIGCQFVDPAVPRPRSGSVDRSFAIPSPEIMRGTIGAEALVLGYDDLSLATYRPIVARGYGLVVGLEATGSRDIPPSLRAHMLTEMSRRGIGSERLGYGHLKPEAMLNSPDTAVVIVEAVIPHGAVEGTRFDVRVMADPRTGTTSLEGGRLYTTELKPGELRTGSLQAATIAEASGPIFLNPFAEPGAVGRDSINRLGGRILNGGLVIEDMPLKLRLATPSHARAATIQAAVNARFPQEPGQRDPTARGETADLVSITVPPSHAGNVDDFVELLKHTTIQLTAPEQTATIIRRNLLGNASFSHDASWRWQALGVRVLPVIRDLYDHPDEQPRMAALRAGAMLDDALTTPHLIEMAQSGSPTVRQRAIILLTDMPVDPMVDMALHELLSDQDIEVRIAAYNAIVARRAPYLERISVDGKFMLDVVDSERPMIYVAQAGEPRIVLFGRDVEIERPLTMQAWSNRLMIMGDRGDEHVEVYYRSDEGAQDRSIHEVEPSIAALLQFFGHQTTIEAPAPGLGLSYSETIGAIHQLWRQQYVRADFKADQDRIRAAIMRQELDTSVVERPEFSDGPSTVSGEAPDGVDRKVPLSDLDRLPSSTRVVDPTVPRRGGPGQP
ncbi:MAG: flagellar basal body P-ring protein FlgI, partial [Planctomycetota bacterium]